MAGEVLVYRLGGRGKRMLTRNRHIASRFNSQLGARDPRKLVDELVGKYVGEYVGLWRGEERGAEERRGVERRPRGERSEGGQVK